MATVDQVKGCDCCGDFPVHVRGRCHPSAPVRVIFRSPTQMEIRCYLPECDRHIATFKVEQQHASN